MTTTHILRTGLDSMAINDIERGLLAECFLDAADRKRIRDMKPGESVRLGVSTLVRIE